MTANNDTFVKITNKDIYLELKKLREEMQKHREFNFEQYTILSKKQDQVNSSVKLNKWIATTAIVMVITLMGFLFNHLNK